MLRRRRFLAGLVFRLAAQGTETRPLVLNRLRYLGGSLPGRVSRFDWNVTMILRQREMELRIGGAKPRTYAPEQVLAVTVGAEAARHVEEALGTAKRKATPALFGALRGDRENQIGLTLEGEAGKRDAILLETHPWGAASLAFILDGFRSRSVVK